jgi:hypothetical protein
MLAVVTQPKALKYGRIKNLMERAIGSQGIERILRQGTSYNTRREWKILHGITGLDNVPSNVRYIKIVNNNVMTNIKKIGLASMVVIVS